MANAMDPLDRPFGKGNGGHVIHRDGGEDRIYQCEAPNPG
jgi:hypothetical protein